MITKGQIQVSIRLKAEVDVFLEAVLLICTEVFLWLTLQIFY